MINHRLSRQRCARRICRCLCGYALAAFWNSHSLVLYISQSDDLGSGSLSWMRVGESQRLRGRYFVKNRASEIATECILTIDYYLNPWMIFVLCLKSYSIMNSFSNVKYYHLPDYCTIHHYSNLQLSSYLIGFLFLRKIESWWNHSVFSSLLLIMCLIFDRLPT